MGLSVAQHSSRHKSRRAHSVDSALSFHSAMHEAGKSSAELFSAACVPRNCKAPSRNAVKTQCIMHRVSRLLGGMFTTFSFVGSQLSFSYVRCIFISQSFCITVHFAACTNVIIDGICPTPNQVAATDCVGQVLNMQGKFADQLYL